MYLEQQSLDFADVTARKHKGSPTSIAANKKASPTKTAWRYLCFDYIRRNGTATSKEVCDHFNKSLNELSGRFSELLGKDGRAPQIEKTGEVRKGCAVYRVIKLNA